MPSISSETVIPIALGLIIVLSLVAFAQPTTAFNTAVSGPSEVTSHDPIEVTIVISSADETEAESYTLTLRPNDEDDSVTITYAPDGSIVATEPQRGVVGTGDIRVNRLLRDLVITPVEGDDDSGYGYGYGYGYDSGESTVTYRVSMPSAALKHGQYTLTASVNMADQTGIGQSNEHQFSVLVPSGQIPASDGSESARTTAKSTGGGEGVLRPGPTRGGL